MLTCAFLYPWIIPSGDTALDSVGEPIERTFNWIYLIYLSCKLSSAFMIFLITFEPPEEDSQGLGADQ